MKIYSWNVNGIRAVQKKGLLQPFLTEHQPDILCLQETKAQPDQVEADFAALLPEYYQYWYSAEKKGYSSTAIFSKEEPLEISNGIPEHIATDFNLVDDYGDLNSEGRVMVAEYDPFYVSTVYTPNSKDDLSRIPMRQQWDPAYLQYMKELQTVKPVIFCGDFNVAHTEIDLARPKPNVGKKGFTAEERNGIDEMLKCGFIDSLRFLNPETTDLYTWWSHFGGARDRNVGWRIDYVMVHETLKELVKQARIHPDILGSDHCPVSVDLSIEL
jgi:exodeoxyribonuclease-3